MTSDETEPANADSDHTQEDILCPCICGDSIGLRPYPEKDADNEPGSSKPQFTFECNNADCLQRILYWFDRVASITILKEICSFCLKKGASVRLCEITGTAKVSNPEKSKVCVLHSKDFKKYESPNYFNRIRLKPVAVYNYVRDLRNASQSSVASSTVRLEATPIVLSDSEGDSNIPQRAPKRLRITQTIESSTVSTSSTNGVSNADIEEINEVSNEQFLLMLSKPEELFSNEDTSKIVTSISHAFDFFSKIIGLEKNNELIQTLYDSVDKNFEQIEKFADSLRLKARSSRQAIAIHRKPADDA